MPTDSPAWVRDAVFYQVFPDRFAMSGRVAQPGPFQPWDDPPTHHGFKGGDLLGIVDHLDDLADLGITALYLNPIFTSASNHRYHTDDYLHVDPLLGGDEALRALVDACHARGMRIVLDGVFNHCGRGFWPFHHVVENGSGSPYRDWFYIDGGRLDAGGSLDPYPSQSEMDEVRRAVVEGWAAPGEASERYLGYRGWWDLPALPKLRTDDPGMRSYLLDVARHWIEFGVDGWRLDVAEEIDAGFWREFRARVKGADPDAYLVAEIWHVAPEWLDGQTFDGLMHYPLGEAIIGFAAGRHLDMGVVAEQEQYRRHLRPLDAGEFGASLQRLDAAYEPSVRQQMLTLVGSHDTPRLRTVCGGDLASVRLAMGMLMTLPGAPCVYYGDELGMEGHVDPDCRRGYPREPGAGDRELREFVRGAIALRARRPSLRGPQLRLLWAEGSSVAYMRESDAEVVVVAANAGDSDASLVLDAPESVGRPVIETWPGRPAHAVDPVVAWEGGRLRVDVPARDFTVVGLDRR